MEDFAAIINYSVSGVKEEVKEVEDPLALKPTM